MNGPPWVILSVCLSVLPHSWLVDQVLSSAVVLHVGVAGVVHGVIGENLLLGTASFNHLSLNTAAVTTQAWI